MPRQYTPKAQCTCAYCDKVFERAPSNVADAETFCDLACYKASRKAGQRTGPTVETNCPTCGKTFRTWPYRLRAGAAHCSPACAAPAKQRGQHVACAVCGTGFYVGAARLRSRYPVRYCSLACRSIAQRKRNRDERESVEYKAWRIAVYQRDHYTCRDCGARHTIHAHHVKPFARFPHLRLAVENGITLCPTCHGKRHGW